MKSARELKGALLAVGTSEEEAEAIVQKGISEGKLDNDIATQAVPEDVFQRALAAIDSALTEKRVVSKSEVDVAAAKVEAALSDSQPDADLSALQAELSALKAEVASSTQVTKSCLRAIKDMFVSMVAGINEVSRTHSSSVQDLAASLSEVRKSLVAPKGARTAAIGPSELHIPDAESDFIRSKKKLVEIMKSESARSDLPPERRKKLSNGFLCLSAAHDYEAVRRIATDLGITLS